MEEAGGLEFRLVLTQDGENSVLVHLFTVTDVEGLRQCGRWSEDGGALVKEDAPLAVFPAPEGAAEGVAGAVVGDVGEESEGGREDFQGEVPGGDGLGRLGGEGLQDGGSGPDAAGRAELTEVCGEEPASLLWVGADGRVVEGALEGDESGFEV
jgi:hypothetical protein